MPYSGTRHTTARRRLTFSKQVATAIPTSPVSKFTTTMDQVGNSEEQRNRATKATREINFEGIE
jgi:hypothetical protein